ncbi:uncharacterized protein SPPG_08821 [Spizellomyces punctatus DAOM BR117]|uniref:Uncharacterized protein n=1 Tax=Spizellomyces punctatus (strain DAOM BR117) TaxID=645134 RepID=A0A0L0HSX6_SPIPD|nr:uncharacterized protein SPPG_08821 [Spizellomyces punctatus DAOM BR117]KND04461.1 hypothetical protein SPPG_08821 [Spizellomyces punctatus DAOM BR117]|eukprot:XP_016612500.1 hypothetical protein SPPG_08821 [Spizellomyces punctatus DAOM BR117]
MEIPTSNARKRSSMESQIPPPWLKRLSSVGEAGGKDDQVMITVRKDGKREILVHYDQDAALLDEIFRRKRGGTDYLGALDLFCPMGGDALVKVAYADPETHWDTILLFKTGNARHAKLRTAFEHALLLDGLILEREEDAHEPSRAYLKVMVPFERLCCEAERMKLKTPIQSSQTSAKFAIRQGSIRSNKLNADEVWSGMINFMRTASTKRQSITFKKTKLAAFMGGNADVFAPQDIQLGFFSNAQRNLLAYNIIVRARLKSLGKQYSRKDFHKLLNDGVFTDIFPLHDGPARMVHPTAKPNRRSEMFKLWKISVYKIPLDDFRDYFGERIAFYFAFLGHFGRWLSIAAIVGLVTFLYGLSMAINAGALE